MPMRATTVRFSEDLWELLDEESTIQGISAAQFVRDATIVRLAFLAGRRGGAESEQSIEAIAERAARRQRSGGEFDRGARTRGACANCTARCYSTVLPRRALIA